MSIKVALNTTFDINLAINGGVADAGIAYSVSPLYASILSVNSHRVRVSSRRGQKDI